MTKDFLKGMLAAGLIVGIAQVNATGFNKFDPVSAGKVMPAEQFEKAMATAKSEDVAKKFGFPDQILTLKSPKGETQGVVWVYKNAVSNNDGLKDARIVFLEGKMKYFALSNAAS